MSRLIAAILIAWLGLSAAAGEIRTASTVDRDAVRLSDSVTLTLSVEADAPLRVEPTPDVLDDTSAANWRARPIGTPNVQDLPNGRQRWVQAYRVDPYVPGEHALGFAPLKVFAGTGPDPVAVDGPKVTVHVSTALAGTGPEEARPTTGIEEVSPVPSSASELGPTVAVIAAVVGFLALGYAVARRLRRTPELVSPEEMALGLLNVLDDPGLSDAEFAAHLAQVVRDIHDPSPAAAKLTTAELLSTAPEDRREALQQILPRCDLTKFAGVSIDADERKSLLEAARQFVLHTHADATSVPPVPPVNV